MPWVLHRRARAVGSLAAAALRPPLRIWAALPVALAGLAYLLARADEFHLVPLAAALPVLLAATAPHARRAAFDPGARAPGRAHRTQRDRPEPHRPDRSRAAPADPHRRGGRREGSARRGARARADGRLHPPARVPPGRPIFVANPRHDLVRVGNPLLYVLADRENPTRYDVMQPGVSRPHPCSARSCATCAAHAPGSWSAGSAPWPPSASPTGLAAPAGCGSSTATSSRLQPGGPLRRLPGPAARPARCGMRCVTTHGGAHEPEARTAPAPRARGSRRSTRAGPPRPPPRRRAPR